MSTPPTTAEPTWEIVNGDQPLSDQAIGAIADLLLALDDEAMETET